MSQRCQATRKDGKPCQAWAVADANPPHCSAHGGAHNIGAPTRNKNRQTHGFYSTPQQPPATIDEAIEHLAASLGRLTTYIHTHPDLTVDEYTRLETVLGQSLSRYIRAKRTRDGTDTDANLQADIDQALTLAGQLLGVQLSSTN